MSRISGQEKIDNYIKSYRNYKKRYNYWANKLGPEYMPEMIEMKDTKSDKIYVKDIAQLEKATAGYFKAQSEYNRSKYTQTEENQNEDYSNILKEKFIREVDMYYNEFMGFADRFEKQTTRNFIESALKFIDSKYSKEEIAYVLRENWDSIQNIMYKAKRYDYDYIRPELEALMVGLSNMFMDAELPYYIDEETWFDNDTDFRNAGDFGEYSEEDMR